MYKKSHFLNFAAHFLYVVVFLIMSSSVVFGYTRITTADDSLTAKVDALFSRYNKSDSPGASVAIV